MLSLRARAAAQAPWRGCGDSPRRVWPAQAPLLHPAVWCCRGCGSPEQRHERALGAVTAAIRAAGQHPVGPHVEPPRPPELGLLLLRQDTRTSKSLQAAWTVLACARSKGNTHCCLGTPSLPFVHGPVVSSSWRSLSLSLSGQTLPPPHLWEARVGRWHRQEEPLAVVHGVEGLQGEQESQQRRPGGRAAPHWHLIAAQTQLLSAQDGTCSACPWRAHPALSAPVPPLPATVATNRRGRTAPHRTAAHQEDARPHQRQHLPGHGVRQLRPVALLRPPPGKALDGRLLVVLCVCVGRHQGALSFGMPFVV